MSKKTLLTVKHQTCIMCLFKVTSMQNLHNAEQTTQTPHIAHAPTHVKSAQDTPDTVHHPRRKMTSQQDINTLQIGAVREKRAKRFFSR